jgi:hypothetical protein
MNKFLLIITFSIGINGLLAQSERMIEQVGGSIYYGPYAQEVVSENSLPMHIQVNARGYLDKILPGLNDSITFSHGQIIDLAKIFAEEPKTYDHYKLVPKYELDFYLQYKNLGIKKYNLQIELDEYGQILSTNWPKKTIALSNSKSLSEIENYALNEAKSKNLYWKTYEIELKYDEDIDELYWEVNLNLNTVGGRTEHYILKIARYKLNILEEYRAFSTVLH